MDRRQVAGALGAVSLVLALLLWPPIGYAQAPAPALEADGDAANPSLLQVPATRLLLPANTELRPDLKNPAEGDPEAINRGQDYFNQFNCVGCHAPNGAGGMGPALSNHHFIYGSAPGQIYLSILQGRPRGMPAWSGKLPEAVIWDLAAYIQSISKDPRDPWDHTVSVQDFDTEQVPAESEKTSDPWSYKESFSFGRAPHQQGTEDYPSTGRRK